MKTLGIGKTENPAKTLVGGTTGIQTQDFDGSPCLLELVSKAQKWFTKDPTPLPQIDGHFSQEPSTPSQRYVLPDTVEADLNPILM